VQAKTNAVAAFYILLAVLTYYTQFLLI